MVGGTYICMQMGVLSGRAEMVGRIRVGWNRGTTYAQPHQPRKTVLCISQLLYTINLCFCLAQVASSRVVRPTNWGLPVCPSR